MMMLLMTARSCVFVTLWPGRAEEEGGKDAVTVYERYSFVGETGASISCAANGTRFLKKWGCVWSHSFPRPD